MLIRRTVVTAAAALAVALPALAHAVVKGDLTLSNLEVRASLGVNPNTGGYLTVANKGATADQLVAISCTCARKVQLHVMRMQGQVMSMDRVNALSVPAHGKLELKPGGAHLMILGVKTPLRNGEKVNMTLTFRRAGKVETFFHVVATPGSPAVSQHQH
jgi:copper(I)-binding protein